MVSLAARTVSVTLGGRSAVCDVDLALDPGGLIGIVGPNGAGKSTLVRALLGLTPYRGRVEIDGVEIGGIARADVARRLAYLPQGQTLHWPLSVERLVGLGRLPHLAPLSAIAEHDQAAVDRAMMRADVAHLNGRIATELSGGERARVLLARALAVEAEGLIADEPLASLDPGHQIDVMELLQAEALAGKLVVTILHDLTMAARYCDRLLLMERGRIAGDGAPLDVLNETNLRQVYGIRARVEATEAGPIVVPLGR